MCLHFMQLHVLSFDSWMRLFGVRLLNAVVGLGLVLLSVKLVSVLRRRFMLLVDCSDLCFEWINVRCR
jgi:hypothetical protein